MPRPHKAVCGKPVDEDLFATRPEASRGEELDPEIDETFLALPRQQQLDMALFPPPDPSFKRSLALELQIRHLRMHQEVHYMVSIRVKHVFVVRWVV